MLTKCLVQVILALAIFQSASADSINVSVIFNDINNAPAWSGLDVNKEGPKLISALEKTKFLTTIQYKELISKLLAPAPSESLPSIFHNWTKVYVLNRYFFKVPSVGVRSKWSGGFQIDYDKNGPLYPLREQSNGQFTIIEGYKGGYMGPSYQGLAEADYFNMTYGPRFSAK